jgi:hypothetical protein
MRLDIIKLYLRDNLLIIKKSIFYLFLLFLIKTLLYKLMGHINFYNLLDFIHRGFIKKSVKYYSLTPASSGQSPEDRGCGAEYNNKLNP